MRIIIVEADPLRRQSIYDILQAELTGATLSVVQNYQRAKEFLAREPACVVSTRQQVPAGEVVNAPQRFVFYESGLFQPKALIDALRGKERAVPLRGKRRDRLGVIDEFIGTSAAACRVRDQAKKLAALDVTVLIEGPTGSGKSYLAKLIHRAGPRHEFGLQTVSCAAIHSELVASELFGCRRGAYTSAHTDRIGRIEAANHGTLLLDDVGEIPLAEQGKLLDALDEYRVTRLGDHRQKSIDVRFMATTNKPLTDATTFRPDLYYRLRRTHLVLPSLAERVEDIPLLVESFVAKHNGKTAGAKVVSADAVKVLQQRRWPGGVRELRDAVENALMMATSEELTARDFS